MKPVLASILLATLTVAGLGGCAGSISATESGHGQTYDTPGTPQADENEGTIIDLNGLPRTTPDGVNETTAPPSAGTTAPPRTETTAPSSAETTPQPGSQAPQAIDADQQWLFDTAKKCDRWTAMMGGGVASAFYMDTSSSTDHEADVACVLDKFDNGADLIAKFGAAGALSAESATHGSATWSVSATKISESWFVVSIT
jgi:hypothetical protein